MTQTGSKERRGDRLETGTLGQQREVRCDTVLEIRLHIVCHHTHNRPPGRQTCLTHLMSTPKKQTKRCGIFDLEFLPYEFPCFGNALGRTCHLKIVNINHKQHTQFFVIVDTSPTRHLRETYVSQVLIIVTFPDAPPSRDARREP